MKFKFQVPPAANWSAWVQNESHWYFDNQHDVDDDDDHDDDEDDDDDDDDDGDDDDDDDDNDIHAGSSSMVSLSFAATPVEPGGPISISIKTIIISDLVNFIKIIVDPKIL